MVFWLIGISGSGKTTLGKMFSKYLNSHNLENILIDGDEVRNTFDNDLGYSKEERIQNVKRILLAAYFLEKTKTITIICNISPFEELRVLARNKIASYHQIYLEKNLNKAIKNDVKGIYKFNTDKTDLVGIDIDFDLPKKSELVINTDHKSIDESLEIIVKYFEKVNES